MQTDIVFTVAGQAVEIRVKSVCETFVHGSVHDNRVMLQVTGPKSGYDESKEDNVPKSGNDESKEDNVPKSGDDESKEPAAEPQHRTPWNEFQHRHKGSGLSSAQLAKLYGEEKEAKAKASAQPSAKPESVRKL